MMAMFPVDAIVWAKVKGHPPWPAMVQQPDDISIKIAMGKQPVVFLGTGEVGTVKVAELLDYDAHRKYELPRRLKGFNNAIQEANEMLGTLTGDIKERFPLAALAAAKTKQQTPTSTSVVKPRSRKNTQNSVADEPMTGTSPKPPRSRNNTLSDGNKSGDDSQPPPQLDFGAGHSQRGRERRPKPLPDGFLAVPKRGRGDSIGEGAKRTKRFSTSSTGGGPVVNDVLLMAAIDELDGDSDEDNQLTKGSSLFPPTSPPSPPAGMLNIDQRPRRKRRSTGRFDDRAPLVDEQSGASEFAIEVAEEKEEEEIQVPTCPKCGSAGRLASDDGKAIVRCMATNCRKKFYRFDDNKPEDAALKQFMMNKVTKPTRLKLAEAVDMKQQPMTAEEKAQMKAERISAQTKSLNVPHLVLPLGVDNPSSYAPPPPPRAPSYDDYDEDEGEEGSMLHDDVKREPIDSGDDARSPPMAAKATTQASRLAQLKAKERSLRRNVLEKRARGTADSRSQSPSTSHARSSRRLTTVKQEVDAPKAGKRGSRKSKGRKSGEPAAKRSKVSDKPCAPRSTAEVSSEEEEEDVKPKTRAQQQGIKLKSKAKLGGQNRATSDPIDGSSNSVALPASRAYYNNSQAELCVRPWLGKRLRNIHVRQAFQARAMSPPRAYGHTSLDAAAATRQSSRTLARMADQVLKETMRETHNVERETSSSIMANASSSVGGTLDLLLDTFMATLGPLTTIAQHLTPAYSRVQGRLAIPSALIDEVWASTMVHTPQNR